MLVSGYDEILGVDLSIKMFEHSTQLGTEYLYGNVASLDVDGVVKFFTLMMGILIRIR